MSYEDKKYNNRGIEECHDIKGLRNYMRCLIAGFRKGHIKGAFITLFTTKAHRIKRRNKRRH